MNICTINKEFGYSSLSNIVGYINLYREFPGGPVVKTPCFHGRRWGVQPLDRELRSQKPCSVAKKAPKAKNKQKREKHNKIHAHSLNKQTKRHILQDLLFRNAINTLRNVKQRNN